MIPILCRAVGHKWFFKKKDEEMVGKRIYRRITHIQVEHCLRCGEPSPLFSSHNQEPERDARIKELEKWRRAAILLGERIGTVGPNGYYSFTADQFFEWVKGLPTEPKP